MGADDHVRCVCISDTHGRHAMIQVPPGDILIHAGDFTMCGADFEVDEFCEWFGALPHPHKILIAGNHDLTCDMEHFVKKNSDSTETEELEVQCKESKKKL